jgi:hypothetical protein
MGQQEPGNFGARTGSEMDDLEVEATNTIARALGRKNEGFSYSEWPPASAETLLAVKIQNVMCNDMKFHISKFKQ